MTIGLKRGTVKLVPHTPAWAASFARERTKLLRTLGSAVIAVEHVGSTAIPGIVAKPIIDIAMGIPRVSGAHRLAGKLKKLGYVLRPESGTAHNVLFVKGPESRRTHYLHVMRYRGVEWRQSLAFRDYLRTHRASAKRYEALKLRLARSFADRREIYTTQKSAFIRSILRRVKPCV